MQMESGRGLAGALARVRGVSAGYWPGRPGSWVGELVWQPPLPPSLFSPSEVRLWACSHQSSKMHGVGEVGQEGQGTNIY